MPNPATGQWFVAQDGQRWWFDSGSIAFDFAYTGGFRGPPEWEFWHSAEDVERWWHERLNVDVSVSADDYEHSRGLRQQIAQAVLSVSHGQLIPLDTALFIDEWAAHPDVPPQLSKKPLVTSDRLLSYIARAAVGALVHTERIRVCGADDCALMYLDTSRSGSRAWCSMKRCGNRHKVRALRERRASLGATNYPRQQKDNS